MTLQLVNWHGFDAWQLENSAVRITIVPDLGAKIASLVDKRTGVDWLAAPSRPVRARNYGDRFTDHDLSGWDEMFPTIDACPAPDDSAVTLPDHGEVWAFAWDIVAQGDDTLILRVNGHFRDYTLTRKATLIRDGLRLEYALENHTEKPLAYLWAAHPLFNGANIQVLLPREVTDVVSVANHPRLGAPDTLLQWPVATLPDGEQRRLDVVREAQQHDYRKVYLRPHQAVASAALRQMETGRQLTMRWDSSAAPYLGIWVDEGTYTESPTVAFEPSSGYYDSLAHALALGRASTLPSGVRANWWVEVALSP
jgi:galactose mutarotase-like enzyme